MIIEYQKEYIGVDQIRKIHREIEKLDQKIWLCRTNGQRKRLVALRMFQIQELKLLINS